MDIPYDLIHKLEDEYGSLTLVPENNLVLNKLRQLLFVADEESKRKAQIEDDDLTLDMLNEGYCFDEITYQIDVSIKKVRSIAQKFHIKAKPHFKYKVTIIKTGQLIYTNNYRNYSILMHHGCDYYEYTKRYLYSNGYKLERLPEFMPWRKLNNGDQYISHHKIYTKGLN